LSLSLKKQKRTNKEFNKVLLRAVDNSLACIGKSVGPVIYYNLERDFVKKEDIPVETRRFSACLKMIFGEGVAYLIEMSIVKRLYVEIDEELKERKEYSFTDYVENAKERYLKKGVRTKR
jgi:hypothetical protein